MNITNKDFEKIEKAIELLPKGDAFNALPEDTQQIILDAEVTLVNLIKKKKRDNARTWNYILEKRKTNKNYGRTPYVKVSERA